MAQGLKLKQPEEMVFREEEGKTLIDKWKSWRKTVELYLNLAMPRHEEKEKCAAVLYIIGQEGRDIFSTWNLTEEEENNLSVIFRKFEEYCNPKSNITLERFKFNSRSQQDGETIENYVIELKKLAKTCQYENLEDDMIRDRIVVGIQSQTLKERLLREGSLTLDLTIDICRAEEQSKKGIQMMAPTEVMAVRKKDYRPKENKSRNEDSNRFNCRKCGKEHGVRACPAYGKKCNQCGKMNHFQAQCRAHKYNKGKKSRKVHDLGMTQEKSSSDDETESFFIGSVNKKTQREDNSAYVTAVVNSQSVRFKIDTGAQANVLPLQTFKKLNKRKELELTKTTEKLQSYSGDKLKTEGKCTLEILGQYITFFVVDTEEVAILGLKASENLNLIKIMMINKENEDETKDKILQEYKDVFTGVGKLEGSYKITLNENTIPVVHPPRRIPLSIQDKVKKELDRMEELGIVKKQNAPTDWVNSMVVVEKKNGNIRICMDPKDLNRVIKREHFAIPSADEISAKLAGARFFTKFDAASGFWQIPLDETSSKLCTMNTPFGRYSFLRCPFGISSIPEIFNRKMKEIFEEEEGIDSFFDDVLVWGKSKKELFTRTKKCLELARKANLTFGKEKSVIGATSLKYLGHIISQDGTKADPEKIEAINQMTVNDKKELQRFLGMVTYVGKYIPNLAEITQPLRTLLQKDVLWHWDETHDRTLEKIKEEITKSPTLKHFDPKKKVVITADASQYGIGAALIQDGQPVCYASRSLSKAEYNYAQIEKETLAVVFACEKFHQFIYGRPVMIENDHRPLKFIFSKTLNKCPPRIQRFLMRLQKYDLSFSYIPGSKLTLADALSRDPNQSTIKDESINQKELETMIHTIIKEATVWTDVDSKLKKEIKEEESLQSLITIIKSGWPEDKSKLPNELKAYWEVRDTLTYESGLILKGQQILIPKNLRREILSKLHEGHLGIEMSKRRAREQLYWPRMSQDIENYISHCEICLRHRNKQQEETLKNHEISEYPWQKVASDIFTINGQNYVLIVDYLSKFVEIALLRDLTSSTLVTHLKSIFSRHGIPETLMTDNATNYMSVEFKRFTSTWGIRHITSSPKYPKSNGLAERNVQTIKRLLKKSKDPYLALLNLRTTPLKNSPSPSELLMGRRLRTTIPLQKNKLITPATKIAQRAVQHSQNAQRRYHRGKSNLPPLSPGDAVFIRNNKDTQWCPAIVQNKADAPRSYVTKSDGTLFRRNRRDILKPRGDYKHSPTSEAATEAPISDSQVRTTMVQTTPIKSPKSSTPPNNNNDSEASTSASLEHTKTEYTPAYTTRSGRTVRKPQKYND